MLLLVGAMFGMYDSEKRFLDWCEANERLVAGYPRLGFLVSFVSIERYLHRTARAIQVFEGHTSKKALKTARGANLSELLEICSDESRGGNPAFAAHLGEIIGDDRWERLRVHRNDIVHGNSLRSEDKAREHAARCWLYLRAIGQERVARHLEGEDRRAPWAAWKKLPRRIKPKKHSPRA